jgi:hypothetical protein
MGARTRARLRDCVNLTGPDDGFRGLTDSAILRSEPFVASTYDRIRGALR